MTRVVIDERLCTGHGRCYAMVESLFAPDQQGRGVVTAGELDSSALVEAQIAVDSCPEQAIAIVDA
jgi:ferredoxin